MIYFFAVLLLEIRSKKKFFVRKFRNSYFLYGNFQFPFIDGKKEVVDTDSCRVFNKSPSFPNRFIVKVIVNLLCNIINFPAPKNPIKQVKRHISHCVFVCLTNKTHVTILVNNHLQNFPSKFFFFTKQERKKFFLCQFYYVKLTWIFYQHDRIGEAYFVQLLVVKIENWVVQSFFFLNSPKWFLLLLEKGWEKLVKINEKHSQLAKFMKSKQDFVFLLQFLSKNSNFLSFCWLKEANDRFWLKLKKSKCEKSLTTPDLMSFLPHF